MYVNLQLICSNNNIGAACLSQALRAIGVEVKCRRQQTYRMNAISAPKPRATDKIPPSSSTCVVLYSTQSSNDTDPTALWRLSPISRSTPHTSPPYPGPQASKAPASCWNTLTPSPTKSKIGTPSACSRPKTALESTRRVVNPPISCGKSD